MGMCSKDRSFRARFTLNELLCIVGIVVVLAAVVFPLFARAHEWSGPSCLSIEKGIGIGIIQYAQDYDGAMPPARNLDAAQSGDAFPDTSWENAVFPHDKLSSRFRCRDFVQEHPKARSSGYCYNDLAAGVSSKDFAHPACTVILMEGDVDSNDAGHAWTPDEDSQPAQFSDKGISPLLGLGATVKNATRRHSGGANYVFADSHVKGIKPEVVFFPPRTSASRSHKDADGVAIGPDPAGDMRFAGTTYAATFHLR